jgi:hypothetical protein
MEEEFGERRRERREGEKGKGGGVAEIAVPLQIIAEVVRSVTKSEA